MGGISQNRGYTCSKSIPPIPKHIPPIMRFTSYSKVHSLLPKVYSYFEMCDFHILEYNFNTGHLSYHTWFLFFFCHCYCTYILICFFMVTHSFLTDSLLIQIILEKRNKDIVRAQASFQKEFLKQLHQLQIHFIVIKSHESAPPTIKINIL